LVTIWTTKIFGPNLSTPWDAIYWPKYNLENNLTIDKWQLDFGHHLNGQGFLSQLVHTLSIVQCPKYDPKSENKKNWKKIWPLKNVD